MCLAVLAVLAIVCRAATPEERALAWLAKEVPAWFSENRCYSCHNNGDAARALYAARRLGRVVSEAALADTTRWLARPAQWETNRGDPRSSDKNLARLQFAAALGEAFDAGVLRDRGPLLEAADLVAKLQQGDGSWQVEGEGAAGSPVTWGTPLATAMARRVLERAGNSRFRDRIARAGQWLAARELRTMPDAAAVLIGLGARREAVDYIRRAQSSDGGWGPVMHAPAEAFDTALVVIALAGLRGDADAGRLISSGREWLIRAQLASGAWTETTRPPGGRSYAQQVSTTGWATLALLS